MKKLIPSISAGKFKAVCLQLMDEVNLKQISIVITKHGKPVAKLVPITDEPINSFGCLKDSITFNDDVLAPIDVKWEVND